MDETTIPLSITLDDVQVLNDIIANSKPVNTTFGKVTQVVSKINKQLQDGLQAIKNDLEKSNTKEEYKGEYPIKTD